LRRERLRRNLDLKQISDELKLSMRFLEAIESERFDGFRAAYSPAALSVNTPAC